MGDPSDAGKGLGNAPTNIMQGPSERTEDDVESLTSGMTLAFSMEYMNIQPEQNRAGRKHPADHHSRDLLLSTSPPSSPLNTPTDRECTELLQPETRPITQEQLVSEVKGIYAGLVMVEKKCVEIDQQQASTTNKLSNEQWHALIGLHRTLLHEHHDFLLASQHPSSSPALRCLATKYAMPARMWEHGIYSFLELLRHRLPDSRDHILDFVYLAYSMMALLMESVPSFEETWIECLGDLARYRMAIEADLLDREVWSGAARMWYNKAADKSPNVGRIQHHLAVLARPNIVQQLFYYSKALVSATPFPDARESIMLLFNPFLQGSEIANQRWPLVESALVKANGVLFTHGSISEYRSLMSQFCSFLDIHIGRVAANFRVQGPEMAASLCAATFDFGNAKAFLSDCFRHEEDLKKAQLLASQTPPAQDDPPPGGSKVKYASLQGYWLSIDHTAELIRANPCPAAESTIHDATFWNSSDAATYACRYLGDTTTVVSQRIRDPNIVPFMHVILAYLFGLSFIPEALVYVECCIPWENIVMFLNTIGRSGVVDSHFEGREFPQQKSGSGRQLPEDFIMRGLIWAQYYFPADFFSGPLVDEEERNLEKPGHGAARAERCLWLGVQLASLKRWIRYDGRSKQFSTTHFAKSLRKMNRKKQNRLALLSALNYVQQLFHHASLQAAVAPFPRVVEFITEFFVRLSNACKETSISSCSHASCRSGPFEKGRDECCPSMLQPAQLAMPPEKSEATRDAESLVLTRRSMLQKRVLTLSSVALAMLIMVLALVVLCDSPAFSRFPPRGKPIEAQLIGSELRRKSAIPR